ncbi:MAG TPA: serine/threonine-protein kinase, partial [Streptosporangiaceae bacterium]
MTDQNAGEGAGRPVQIGSLIAGYRIEERIGAGGMAVVFRAHDLRLDRRVALKLLAPELALDSGFRQRFVRESRAAAAVDDPHIIPVFDAGEADGVLFIAMRYVRGGDVRSLIDRSGPLPPGRAADMISQVASALDAAHRRGLVHRDVKPANMLLESRPASDLPDHVYLSDFGLTKASLGTSLALTATGDFMGTLEYVAPEQIEGRVLDGRCDEYSLACAAFEMLCGRPPFRAEQPLSVMDAHLNQSPPQILRLRPDLPARVQPVLSRALAKAPDDRYANCGEFAAALRQALAGQSPNLGGASATHPATEFALPPVGDSAAAAPSGAIRHDNTLPVPAGAGRTRPAGQRPPAHPG